MGVLKTLAGTFATKGLGMVLTFLVGVALSGPAQRSGLPGPAHGGGFRVRAFGAPRNDGEEKGHLS